MTMVAMTPTTVATVPIRPSSYQCVDPSATIMLGPPPSLTWANVNPSYKGPLATVCEKSEAARRINRRSSDEWEGAHQATPAVAYTTRPKASPGQRNDPHYRVRHDRVDIAGSVTVRINGRLHRTNPRPNPHHHHPRRRPRHPHHPRRHRRNPARPHLGHHPRLPADRRTQRPNTTKNQTNRTPMRVRSVSDLLRDHISGGGRI